MLYYWQEICYDYIKSLRKKNSPFYILDILLCIVTMIYCFVLLSIIYQTMYRRNLVNNKVC